MALWEVTINKELGDEEWTNVYWCEAANIDAAADFGFAVYERERAASYSQVYFKSYRVSDGIPNTDVFRIVPLGNNGAVAPTADLLPLFNTVRVDFGAAQGRPSRKYLRGVLTEGDIQYITVQINALARIQDYASAMRDDDRYVDVDGQPILTGAPAPLVQMRQLRRGSKRRIPVP